MNCRGSEAAFTVLRHLKGFVVSRSTSVILHMHASCTRATSPMPVLELHRRTVSI